MFPRPDNKIILIDLDKTIIDKNYQITDESLLPVLQKAQEEGWVIGLSSDTPLAALKIWAKRLGVSGPILAERGAVIYDQGKETFTRSVAHDFYLSRVRCTQLIQQHPEIQIQTGNPVEFLRKDPQVEPNQKWFFLNTFRQVSLSFHTRVSDAQGNLVINPAFHRQIAKLLRKLYPQYPDLDVEENDEYGIVLVSRLSNNKRNGTQELMKQNEWQKIAMIGDSMGDYVGKDLVIQYAVGNAKPDYIAHSDYIAEAEYSTGVKEIIEKLIQ